MEGIVLLVGQIGVVLAGFIGTASAISWYHNVGGKKNDRSSSPLSSKNVR